MANMNSARLLPENRPDDDVDPAVLKTLQEIHATRQNLDKALREIVQQAAELRAREAIIGSLRMDVAAREELIDRKIAVINGLESQLATMAAHLEACSATIAMAMKAMEARR